MSEFDARPPARAVVPAALAAVLALVPALSSGVGLAVGASGALLVVGGGLRGRRLFVSAGAATLAVGVVLGAATGIDPGYALVGGVGTVVAYDAAEHAVGLGVDVGRHARVTQSVVVHVLSTTALALTAATVALAAYTLGPSTRPVAALLALLFGGVLLAAALRT
ncbi:hypothetical protein [Halobacterium salinarum]|uniref:Uncharacterized protein n=6 Tax=Halobacterium salinarum TaxID=2242 RepID=A0A510N483_HALSA|nr:hypothetical protein [Halobacterium salinarum]MBB6090666.1 hypothetical protein [Halobacterium salinarum]MDL0125459.1 hypothetical protein [Halobacterium salinarum]MDL0134674.1 hypothetical protein [Halobacterium salinarum]QCC44101.1 uncharacterized protein HBSAL_01855 [Halobacterium salinarum]TYO76851.1 hypothetical protein APQ99_01493 [Halobacterium salinarum DSM 3754]